MCGPTLGLPCCWSGQATLVGLCSATTQDAADSKTEPADPSQSTETSSTSTVTLSQTQTAWSADLELGWETGSHLVIWTLLMLLNQRSLCRQELLHIYRKCQRQGRSSVVLFHSWCSAMGLGHQGTQHLWKGQKGHHISQNFSGLAVYNKALFTGVQPCSNHTAFTQDKKTKQQNTH